MRKVLLFACLLLLPGRIFAQAGAGAQTGSSSGAATSAGFGGANYILASLPNQAKICLDASVTNGSPNISSAGQCQWTSADVGKKIFVTNVCNGAQCDFINDISSITILPTQLTVARIATITDATHIIVDCAAPGTCASPNATATLASNATVLYGLDNTTAINNAWATVINGFGCQTLQLPQGMYFFNLPIFTTIPSVTIAPCGNGQLIKDLAQAIQFNGGGGPVVKGTGQNSTILIPTPDFTNPGALGQCIGGFLNSTFSDFAVSGFGQSLLGAAFSPCGMLFSAASSQVINVTLHGWAARCASCNGLVNSNGFAHFTHVEVFGFGGNSSCVISGDSNTMVQTTCGLAGGISSGSSISITGNLQSTDSTFISGNPSNNPQIDIGSSAIWQSTNDRIFGISANTGASDDIKIENGGIAYISSMLNTSGGANNNGIEIVAGGTLYLNNYHHTGAAVNRSLLNSGTFFDGGNNSYTGPVSSTGSYFGSISTTGTACVTGNWALTSGWGASSITSVTTGGDSHRCQVVITGAAGAASPVLTWTFPKAYVSAPGSCQISFNGTLTGESTGAPSTSSVAFTFTGTPSAQTYRLDASCGP